MGATRGAVGLAVPVDGAAAGLAAGRGAMGAALIGACGAGLAMPGLTAGEGAVGFGAAGVRVVALKSSDSLGKSPGTAVLPMPSLSRQLRLSVVFPEFWSITTTLHFVNGRYAQNLQTIRQTIANRPQESETCEGYSILTFQNKP